ncbi:MAG: alpha/beta fold hydrolase [Deltaproteobacteria bacterium]|nr:alpha/beta fold hydrolase [Deltaproteobacteria bacterium]
MATRFTFPVGYCSFHNKQLFNYQLNRWHSLGYLPYDAMVDAGRRISDFATWRGEMHKRAEEALKQGKLIEAAFYYRAEEFYTIPPCEREALYERFSDLFYKAFANDGIETHRIPYEDSYLHAMRLSGIPDNGKRGTIVVHGGFDSFIEEFYSMMCHFAYEGYDVVGFDGPGQGATRRRYGIAFDYQWEKPMKAVLDHFHLDNITLLGLSMGGWLCLRASAFEKRIRRVIANGHAYDYYKIPPLVAQWMMTFFNAKLKDATNRMAQKGIEKGGRQGWETSNVMYITKIDVPMAAAEYAWQMNEKNLHPDLVDQDVLILTGKGDHFIPYKLHDKQVSLLSNARSLTDKVFTKAESAQNHCQIGNVGLALKVMTVWISKQETPF